MTSIVKSALWMGVFSFFANFLETEWNMSSLFPVNLIRHFFMSRANGSDQNHSPKWCFMAERIYLHSQLTSTIINNLLFCFHLTSHDTKIGWKFFCNTCLFTTHVIKSGQVMTRGGTPPPPPGSLVICYHNTDSFTCSCIDTSNLGILHCTC